MRHAYLEMMVKKIGQSESFVVAEHDRDDGASGKIGGCACTDHGGEVGNGGVFRKVGCWCHAHGSRPSLYGRSHWTGRPPNGRAVDAFMPAPSTVTEPAVLLSPTVAGWGDTGCRCALGPVEIDIAKPAGADFLPNLMHQLPDLRDLTIVGLNEDVRDRRQQAAMQQLFEDGRFSSFDVHLQ